MTSNDRPTVNEYLKADDEEGEWLLCVKYSMFNCEECGAPYCPTNALRYCAWRWIGSSIQILCQACIRTTNKQ